MMTNWILFNLCMLTVLGFFWIFAPVLLPLILLITAGLMIIINLGFYAIFAWAWLNRE